MLKPVYAPAFWEYLCCVFNGLYRRPGHFWIDHMKGERSIFSRCNYCYSDEFIQFGIKIRVSFHNHFDCTNLQLLTQWVGHFILKEMEKFIMNVFVTHELEHN